MSLRAPCLPGVCGVLSPGAEVVVPLTAMESLCLIPGPVMSPFLQLLTSFVCCSSLLT